MLFTEQLGELMSNVKFNDKIDKALIQRCVDKGLLDKQFLQKSIDMEMMTLVRRIIDQTTTTVNTK